MFEHRLSKFGRTILLALCLLFVGGMQQSCKDWLDDYKYDDSEPDWLGASVYAFLQEGTPSHSYKNYVELIDSLGERETLEKTGSKTLFVADDNAFARFYENNPWGVKNVAEMTHAQRKFLFYNTMLNNAVLLDMMPNTSENSEGDCLARETEFNPLDSIPLVHENYYPNHPSWPTYNQYWELFAKKKDTLLLAMTSASMIHFFDDYLKRNAISVSDLNFIFQKGGDGAKAYKQGDIFLYGNKLVDGEVDTGNFSEDKLTVVCKNGYVYRMDEVLLPPADMAGELRNRKDTRIFSHLLDRFCIPVFDLDKSSKYRVNQGVENDSVFELRYFTKTYDGGTLFNGTKVDKPALDERLRYDPGDTKGNSDVYAMLVPKDEPLYEYFADPLNGAGNFLLERYAPEVEIDPNYSEEGVEKLLTALDSIPQVSIATFLNNLMQESFAATVPSKFDRITDDANDDMKITETDVDECKIANNGVLYILNKVFSPAKFSSVAGPVDINENMRIMKTFINDLKYNYYLLAMDADYSLVVPGDNNFVYYDPLTYGNHTNEGHMVMYALHFDAKHKDNNTKNPYLWHEKLEINDKTLQITDTLSTAKGYPSNIASELLEYLIIVHDKVEPRVHENRLYYSTKGYGTIKVDARGENIKFYGGEQLEKGTEIVAVDVISQTNGNTYSTAPVQESTETVLYSSVPTPPTKSIYQNMLAHADSETNDGLYEEFFNLCYPRGEKSKTLKDALTTIHKKVYDSTIPEDTIKMYSIFYTDGKMTNCVPFLNTYHYTVYIPSNEDIQRLYGLGLPQWTAIENEINDNPKRAMSMIRLVNNFVRYHFQDQSVYCDISPFFVPNVDGGKDYEASLATSLINNDNGRFYDLTVKSEGGTIVLEDEWVREGEVNQWARVVNTPAENENKTWNVMCRDCKGTTTIETSSYSVLQPIDRALLNNSFFGYDGRFARFAVTGERVDTMSVTGGKGGFINGNNCYLVAKAGRIPHSTDEEPQPEGLSNVEIAYLMQPISSTDAEWNSDVAREALVYDEEGLPILISKEGYRVTKTVDTRYDEVTYDYYTVAADGKNYKIKVSNTGAEIYREEIINESDVESPETGEEGSNGENSDEE